MGNVIKIVGTGPGHPDYITPKALQAIREAQVLIGALRLLRDYAQPGQECRAVGKDLNAVLDYILKQPRHKTIAVLVSGDPGFFSMARYLKSRLHWLDFEYIPGISSVQYMFARLQQPWQEVPFYSLHGRQGEELVKWAASAPVVALLTGGVWSPQAVAKSLVGKMPDLRVAIGVNLSYPDEKLFYTTLKALVEDNTDYSNSVMVIFND
jgi:cobalt-precorrin-7 (C5)-methyltransferase